MLFPASVSRGTRGHYGSTRHTHSPQVSPEARGDTAATLGPLIPRKCLPRHEGTLRQHSAHSFPASVSRGTRGHCGCTRPSQFPQVSPEVRGDTAATLGPLIPRSVSRGTRGHCGGISLQRMIHQLHICNDRIYPLNTSIIISRRTMEILFR